MAGTSKDKVLADKDIAKRADAGLKALLKMPPKPHDQITGKSEKKTKPDTKKPNQA